MEIDAGRFTVRLARDDVDVAGAQRLRYRVFVEELGAAATDEERRLRCEIDEFDPHFEHMILIDNACASDDPLDRVAGAYRLMTGERARAGLGFYGATEYDLGLLERTSRKVVELGRSCVGREVRGGAAMHLLWTGLGDYVTTRGIEILFGVASFHGSDPDPLAHALSFLHHNHLAPPDLRVRALPHHFTEMNRMPPEAVDRTQAARQIPTLIKAYLRLGGVVGEGAFIDRDFNTVDVCLLMDTTRMVQRYRSFYGREAGGPAGASKAGGSKTGEAQAGEAKAGAAA